MYSADLMVFIVFPLLSIERDDVLFEVAFHQDYSRHHHFREWLECLLRLSMELML